jgi:hypothetical protein
LGENSANLVTLIIRVTQLGEFSPFVRLVTKAN